MSCPSASPGVLEQGSEGDVGDLDLGVLLAVTLALLVAGLVLVLLDDDLGALGGAEDLDGHGGLVQRLGVGGDLLAIDDEDDREVDRLAGGRGDLVDLDDVAHGNLLLLGACAHDRVHRGLLRRSCLACCCSSWPGAHHAGATQKRARLRTPKINTTDGGDAPKNPSTRSRRAQRLREPFFLIGTCSTCGCSSPSTSPTPGSALPVPGSTVPSVGGSPTEPNAPGGGVAAGLAGASSPAGGPAGRVARRPRVRVTTFGGSGAAAGASGSG